MCSYFVYFYVNFGHTYLQVMDELEHLLDDDEDMAEMYLTEKLVQQHIENSSVSYMNERDDMDVEVSQSNMDHRYMTISLYLLSMNADCLVALNFHM